MKTTHTLSIAFVLPVVLLLFLGNPSQKQAPKSDSLKLGHQQTVLRTMITTYCSGMEHYLSKAEPYLAELAELDPDVGSQWDEIMRFWDYANYKMPLNDEPPEDLETDNSLCFVILGYELNADGSMREEMLGRLEKALACAEKYPESTLLCSGGGANARFAKTSEGQAMADWLIEHGVDQERILVESASMTTTENVIFSFELLRDEHPEVKSVAVISSDYHVPWGAVLFQTKFILENSDLRVISNVALNTTPSFPTWERQRDGVMKIAGLI